MTKTIAQVHQAAIAFRTQFRPLIEILDEVAELNDLENTLRELNTQVNAAYVEQAALQNKNLEANAELKKTNLRIAEAKALAEKQAQTVAEEIATARRVAADEAQRVRGEVSAEIKRRQEKAGAKLADIDEAVATRQKEVETLEARLDLLRKAIAGIVAGSSE